MQNAAPVTDLILLLNYVWVYEINLAKQSLKGRKLLKRLKSNNFETFRDYLSASDISIMVRITKSSVKKLLSILDEYVRHREQEFLLVAYSNP